MAGEAQNIYCLALYRESSLTLGLKEYLEIEVLFLKKLSLLNKGYFPLNCLEKVFCYKK